MIKQYIRKPLTVEAVQLTENNYDEFMSWVASCPGHMGKRREEGKKGVGLYHSDQPDSVRYVVLESDWGVRGNIPNRPGGDAVYLYTDEAFHRIFEEVV